jgi:hypothetical protein
MLTMFGAGLSTPEYGYSGVLERRHHQHPRIIGKDVFGAVAMMDVEIDDRHALDAVDRQRVRGADRDVVEEAEAPSPGDALHGGRAGERRKMRYGSHRA